MLKLVLTLSLAALATAARPQSILDLTEQLALDEQKLSSMKNTLQEMYRGYTALEQGYTRIRDIAKGSFTLHQAFLDALWVVSPAVRDDPRIMTILNTAYSIVSSYKAVSVQVASSPVFTAQELDYIIGTLTVVLERCQQAVEELTLVTTDNALRMSDAQRLQALDRIDGEIKGELGFLQQFNNTLAVETAQRTKEAGDINTLKNLYGIPN